MKIDYSNKIPAKEFANEAFLATLHENKEIESSPTRKSSLGSIRKLHLAKTDIHPQLQQAELLYQEGLKRMHFWEKDYELAINLFTQAIELNPTDARFWAARGKWYYLISQAGVTNYKKEEKTPPSCTWKEGGRRALADFQEAYRLTNGNPDIAYEIGSTYWYILWDDEGLKWWEEAAKKGNKDAIWQLNWQKNPPEDDS